VKVGNLERSPSVFTWQFAFNDMVAPLGTAV